MQLNFEVTQNLGETGERPAVYHTPDNDVQVLFIRDGILRTMNTSVEYGNFADAIFEESYEFSPDESVEYFNLTYVPRVNVFATWKNTTNHRLALFDTSYDFSEYFQEGRFNINRDSSISDIIIKFSNPSPVIGNAEDTMARAGDIISIFVEGENSIPFNMGTFYIDKADINPADNTISIYGRNSIGKILKDQTLDQRNEFPLQNVSENISTLLNNSTIREYEVQPSGESIGLSFSPKDNYYQAVKDFCDRMIDWQIREDKAGIIYVGDEAFISDRGLGNGHFDIRRERDAISRGIIKDDKNVYSKVCCYSKDFSIQVYRDIESSSGWVLPEHKTFYYELPDDSNQIFAEAQADKLKEVLSGTGVIEIFSAAFTPNLSLGDRATISDVYGENPYEAVIVSVNHMFGLDGYYTQFVADSGGTLKLPDFD